MAANLSKPKKASTSPLRSTARPTRVRKASPQLSRRTRFSGPTLIVLALILAIAGVSFVLLSRASSKPYSRLDCTKKNHYQDVAGPSVTPPIANYATRPGSNSTVPSLQACLDKSSEAMVAKIYKLVSGNNISANQGLYQQEANIYIGYRNTPPIEYASAVLAKPGNGFKALPVSKQIEALYTRAVGRQPDAKGSKYWTQYMKTNGPAKTIPAFLASPEALRATQAFSNAALASLPTSYRPEASECKHGLNKKECLAFIRSLQKKANDEKGEPCKQYTKGGSVTPLCLIGSKGGVDDVVVTQNIDGSSASLNTALKAKFTALRQAAKREAGVNITAYDREGKGYGSFRTSAMQQKLINQGIGAAPLGSSMHQWGLAIDFGCDNKSYSKSGAKCQNWMKANASRFGFYNLPSEAWHYSTNGR